MCCAACLQGVAWKRSPRVCPHNANHEDIGAQSPIAGLAGEEKGLGGLGPRTERRTCEKKDNRPCKASLGELLPNSVVYACTDLAKLTKIWASCEKKALEEKWSATSPSIVASPRRACPTFTGSTEGRCTRHLWLQLVCLVEPLSILPFHAHTGFPLEPKKIA